LAALLVSCDKSTTSPVDTVGMQRDGGVVVSTQQLIRPAGQSVEFAGRPVDLVVSDMAPNLSGIASSDSARVAHLVELAVEFSCRHLKPEGALVAKVFHGSGYSQLVELFKREFRVVKPIKPKASRDKSAETFLVGIGLKKAGLHAPKP
jgi:23S rRNA U2552 (ribose-2'-O)-methylase RlmE/FtsJ